MSNDVPVTQKPLVLIGAGGFSKEILATWLDATRLGPAGAVLGLVDEEVALHGSRVCGYPVLGDLHWLIAHGLSGLQCVVGVADPKARARIVRTLDNAGAHYANVIHPTAVIWSPLPSRAGIVIQPGVFISVDARIGRHVHLNDSATIGHDVRVGDFVTVGPRADINGNCTLGEGAYVGCQGALRQGITTGPWATVGMCSCVLHDVPAGETVAGVPSRRILSSAASVCGAERRRTSGRLDL